MIDKEYFYANKNTGRLYDATVMFEVYLTFGACGLKLIPRGRGKTDTYRSSLSGVAFAISTKESPSNIEFSIRITADGLFKIKTWVKQYYDCITFDD